MNGAHDLGGMHGLGPINPEPEAEEAVFHAAWERRVFALSLAAGALGQWNIDMSRYARERQHPVDYLRHTYYENWLAGLEKLLVERGLVTAEELAAGKAAGPAHEDIRKRLLKAEQVAAVLAQRPGTALHRERSGGPGGHAPAPGGLATCLSPHAPRSAGAAVCRFTARSAGALTPLILSPAGELSGAGECGRSLTAVGLGAYHGRHVISGEELAVLDEIRSVYMATGKTMTVLNPMGYPPKVTHKALAPRLDTLDGKTVYLVDCRFDDADVFLTQVQAWFAEHMPSVKTVLKPISNVYTKDDPATWAEIKANGDAAIIGVGH